MQAPDSCRSSLLENDSAIGGPQHPQYLQPQQDGHNHANTEHSNRHPLHDRGGTTESSTGRCRSSGHSQSAVDSLTGHRVQALYHQDLES